MAAPRRFNIQLLAFMSKPDNPTRMINKIRLIHFQYRSDFVLIFPSGSSLKMISVGKE